MNCNISHVFISRYNLVLDILTGQNPVSGSANWKQTFERAGRQNKDNFLMGRYDKKISRISLANKILKQSDRNDITNEKVGLSRQNMNNFQCTWLGQKWVINVLLEPMLVRHQHFKNWKCPACRVLHPTVTLCLRRGLIQK